MKEKLEKKMSAVFKTEPARLADDTPFTRLGSAAALIPPGMFVHPSSGLTAFSDS
jgi:hypothetical protein